MIIILPIVFIFVGLFFIFFAIRGSKVVDWRSEVRDAIQNYNKQFIYKITDINGFDYYMKNKMESEDILLSFNDC